MQPKLMLFDEVTALDPELIKGGLDVMAVLASEGMTMVVVTTRWASPGGDSRVQFLDQGVVLEEGEPTRMFGDRSIGRVPRRRPGVPGVDPDRRTVMLRVIPLCGSPVRSPPTVGVRSVPTSLPSWLLPACHPPVKPPSHSCTGPEGWSGAARATPQSDVRP